ncbi:DUF6161 domain-containing protein [Brevundimonas sp.]|uniref:DUF6161 domain-containing protein n=1 Tax=Brevundimonas sp. TaxID=1871086 RepID=UPI002FC9D5ED
MSQVEVTPVEGVEPFRFSDWNEFEAVIVAEEAEWSWLLQAEATDGALTVRDKVRAGYAALRRRAVQARNQSQSVRVMADAVTAAYAHDGALVHHAEELADRINEARKLLGDHGGIFVYGFQRGVVGMADAKSPDDLRAALWTIAPAIEDTASLADLLRRERTNARNTVRGIVRDSEASASAQNEEWRALLAKARLQSLRWARRRARRWRDVARAWDARYVTAVESIRAVEQSYREAMALQAPVEYWNAKATAHRTAERKARIRLQWFFPVALILIVGMFAGSAAYLLTVPTTALPPGLYFIASAGLAAAAGLLFWIGRLLTKLYLSEHHLRHDAEERAVMTTTYLALTAEQAASDTDRQIVLNALFRGTSDGIVKEEGGLDPSIAAMLAKAMVR